MVIKLICALIARATVLSSFSNIAITNDASQLEGLAIEDDALESKIILFFYYWISGVLSSSFDDQRYNRYS